MNIIRYSSFFCTRWELLLLLCFSLSSRCRRRCRRFLLLWLLFALPYVTSIVPYLCVRETHMLNVIEPIIQFEFFLLFVTTNVWIESITQCEAKIKDIENDNIKHFRFFFFFFFFLLAANFFSWCTLSRPHNIYQKQRTRDKRKTTQTYITYIQLNLKIFSKLNKLAYFVNLLFFSVFVSDFFLADWLRPMNDATAVTEIL